MDNTFVWTFRDILAAVEVGIIAVVLGSILGLIVLGRAVESTKNLWKKLRGDNDRP